MSAIRSPLVHPGWQDSTVSSIARIVPAGAPTPLERLIAEGRVQPAREPKRLSRDPVPVAGTASDLVTAQRR